jgi:hypothetical protein
MHKKLDEWNEIAGERQGHGCLPPVPLPLGTSCGIDCGNAQQMGTFSHTSGGRNVLLPESDAKFKNCPLLTTPEGKLKFCLCSGCMMWRWEADGKEKGYCGLAGKPAGMAG